MGWMTIGTYRTKAEANKAASKLRARNRAKGLGRSMAQHGSGHVSVHKARNGWEVWERS